MRTTRWYAAAVRTTDGAYPAAENSLFPVYVMLEATLRRRLRVLLPLSLMVVVPVAACKEDVDERTAKPCELITKDEVASVLGGPASVTSDYNTDGRWFCEWTVETKPGFTKFSVLAWYGRKYYGPDIGGDRFTAVSGIGDAASRGEALHGDLVFRKGPHVFRVSHFETDNDRRQVAIASIIIGRL
jgi:hypothetical protein